MKFCDWDNRPAVLDGDWAFAVVSPGGPWKSVDRDDVRETAGVMSEADWRKRFFAEFGGLDLSEIPDHSDAKRPAKRKPDYSSIFTSELEWAQKY